MVGYKYYNKFLAYLLIVCLFCVLLISGDKVYAEEQTLPSGVSYDDIEDVIKNYIQENAETTAGLAYSVFDISGDITSGYYGYSDIENGIAVDDDTVFEWGSGSKPIVWICVMQLYEQGKLDLNADISEYLPDNFLTNLKYDTPITMLNLMNHDAGFQDQTADVNLTDLGDIDNLEKAVSKHKPQQIFEPGSVTAYSNWGVALAAYIVERLSGMEYYEYVKENIFEPLGMEHSAISSDLSDNEWVKEQREKLKCYSTDNTLIVNSSFYITIYPAGRCNSTFGDYEKFAKALLTCSDKLLKEETWELMYTPTDYFGDTNVAKNYHGLWGVYFDVPTVGHIGRTTGCSSCMLLDIEDGIGVVVMSNQGNESVYTESLFPLVYGDYSPANYSVGYDTPSGTYRCAKISKVGPFKITSLLMGLTKDLDKEYWTLITDGSSSTIELAYMDYTKVPTSQVLFEYVILILFAVGLVFSIISLIWGMIRALKHKKNDKINGFLSTWSVVTNILPLVILFMFLMVMQSVYNPSNTYLWMFIVIAVVTLCMAVMDVVGIVRNIRFNLTHNIKVYNYLSIFFSVIAIINVLYWNLFMFWKM
jgi:CubicO group peptidase (beta-lactamase class C family)